MKGLDFKNFKKVKEDQKSAYLKHPKGHEIKIAKSGLSPSLREQLAKLPMPKKMAEGGDPGDDTQDTEALAAADPQPAAPVDRSPAGALDPQSPAPATDSPDFVGPPSPDPGPSAIQDHSQDVVGAPGASPVQDTAQQLKAEDVAWHNDLQNGHITPETYSDLFAKKDTLGKIGTLFGLMVSGAGSGMSHQPNAVLEMMNKQIKNDLDAQVQSKTNAENYIKLNQQQQFQNAQIEQMQKTGQLTEAQARAATTDSNLKSYALSQMQMNRAALHKLTTDVSKLPPGSPQRQQAESSLALMYNAVNNENFSIADRAAGASMLTKFGTGNGSDPEQQFQQNDRALKMSGNEPIAKDMESKHFPGIKGQSSLPLSDDDRTQINSGITFQKQLQRFQDWTKTHSGDLSPSDKNEGQALAAGLQGAYRQATHGGVYKSGEQDFISNIIDSDPTKFFNKIRVMPQLAAVQKDAAAQLDQLAKSKGFSGYSGVQSSGSSSPQYKTVNGVTYMRGPKGEAIKVK